MFQDTPSLTWSDPEKVRPYGRSNHCAYIYLLDSVTCLVFL